RDGLEAGLVAHQRADGDGALARLGELRPVASDRRIQCNEAAFDETEEANGGGGFADGPDVDDGVARPWPGACPVLPAGPEVHDEFAIAGDADRGADFVLLGEVAFERLADTGEGRIAG